MFWVLKGTFSRGVTTTYALVEKFYHALLSRGLSVVKHTFVMVDWEKTDQLSSRIQQGSQDVLVLLSADLSR